MKLVLIILKNIKRNGLVRTIFSILRYLSRLKYRVEYQNMLKKKSLAERFNQIYEKNLWGSAEAGSGQGSELEYTKPLRSWLIQKLPELNVKTFVDAPCGDFNWMREVLPKVDIEYLGFDIVEPVIRENQKAFGSEKISFAVADICKDRLPDCDLLMVRDCLFHLSFDDINKFLKNIDRVKYRYLLTTNHILEPDYLNSDIVSGDFRLIDLFSAPFNFKKDCLFDRVLDSPKSLRVKRELILVEKVHVPNEISRVARSMTTDPLN